jgi:hypothetical protein
LPVNDLDEQIEHQVQAKFIRRTNSLVWLWFGRTQAFRQCHRNDSAGRLTGREAAIGEAPIFLLLRTLLVFAAGRKAYEAQNDVENGGKNASVALG